MGEGSKLIFGPPNGECIIEMTTGAGLTSSCPIQQPSSSGGRRLEDATSSLEHIGSAAAKAATQSDVADALREASALAAALRKDAALIKAAAMGERLERLEAEHTRLQSAHVQLQSAHYQLQAAHKQLEAQLHEAAGLRK